MSPPLDSDVVATAFHHACLAELDALKPGNVHQYADGHGMEVADFEASAAAAAPIMGEAGLSVGERIEKAIKATRGVVNQNTNLGIVLLAAPLAQAALIASGQDLAHALTQVINTLTVEDARAAYRAIRMAEAGGLGVVPEHDVAVEPDVTLFKAMHAAAERDRIAWNYTHNYVDVFNLGMRWYRGGKSRWGDVPWVTTYVYMGFLAHVPDTLIIRKFDSHTALRIVEQAQPIEAGLSQSRDPREMAAPLLSFDRSLKERSINPGTSADLTVATLFASSLIGG